MERLRADEVDFERTVKILNRQIKRDMVTVSLKPRWGASMLGLGKPRAMLSVQASEMRKKDLDL